MNHPFIDLAAFQQEIEQKGYAFTPTAYWDQNLFFPVVTVCSLSDRDKEPPQDRQHSNEIINLVAQKLLIS